MLSSSKNFIVIRSFEVNELLALIIDKAPFVCAYNKICSDYK